MSETLLAEIRRLAAIGGYDICIIDGQLYSIQVEPIPHELARAAMQRLKEKQDDDEQLGQTR